MFVITQNEIEAHHEYLKNRFEPPLDDKQLTRYLGKRCIYCGSDNTDPWSPDVPLCHRCDAIAVATMEDQFEVPWSTHPSEE